MPNSSPPKRATMSPGRRWARRRGATARSSSSPAWWPRLSLISLKWSRSRKRIPIGEPEAVGPLQRLAEGVDEAEPVGQAGERVVQDAVAQGLVGGVALDRVGEHVGGGLHEGDVLGAEAVGLGRVDVEHAEGVVLAVDHHRQAAGGAEDAQHRRHREAALARTSRRRSRACRSRARRRHGSRARRRRGGRRRRSRSSRPARRLRRRPSRAELPDAGAVDAVDFADQRGGGAHQRLGVAVLQGPLAELGDDGLLGERPLQLVLGLLALGDVVEDAVPDRHPVLVGLEHGLVEHPDDVAPAGAHPVLDRAGVAVAEEVLAFGRQRLLAVLGVEEARPEPRIGLELLRGVAEDLLDLGADVVPLAVLAQLGGVDDHRQALDQAPVVLPPGGDLVEEFADLVVGPVPVPFSRHPVVDRQIVECLDRTSVQARTPAWPGGVICQRPRGSPLRRPGAAAGPGQPADAGRRARARRPARERARTARRTPRPRRPWRGGRDRRGGRPA